MKEIETKMDEFSLNLCLCRFNSLKVEIQSIIVDVVYNQVEDPIKYWEENRTEENSVLSGLVMMFMFREMVELFRIEGLAHKQEDYEKYHRLMDLELQKTKFDHKLLGVDFRMNLLQSSETNDSKIELLEIALKAKAKNFIANKTCQQEVQKRWNPIYRISQPSYFIGFDIIYYGLAMVFPWIVLIERYNWRSMKKERRGFFHIAKTIYFSPASKFFYHWLLRLFYFILMVYSLASVNPYPLYQYLTSVAVFHLLHIFDSVSKYTYMTMVVTSESTWALRKFAFKSSFSGEDLLFFIILVTALLHGLIPPEETVAKFLPSLFNFLFYVCFVYSTLYLQFILTLDHFYSSIVLTMKKMIFLAFRFFVLFLFFWFAYGLSVVNIQDYYVKNEKRDNIVWRVFKSGSFEIFGESEDKFGENSINCTEFQFNSTNWTAIGARCFVDSWLLPVSLFLYMFASAIILVNLLTAFLTQIHDAHQETRIAYRLFKKTSYLLAYEKPCVFPTFKYMIYKLFDRSDGYKGIDTVEKQNPPVNLNQKSNTLQSLQIQSLKKN